MRISDWSSDVCSSDLAQAQASRRAAMTSFPMLAPRTWRPLGAARTVALVSSLAVLFIGEVMGQPPCNLRSEEHTSELQSLMRISYAVFRVNKKLTTEDKLYTRQIVSDKETAHMSSLN